MRSPFWERYDEREAQYRGGSRLQDEYGLNRTNAGSARGDYRNSAYGGRLDERDVDRSSYRNRSSYKGRNDRDFVDRASDEILSWFGDDEAERRRKMDARRNEREKRSRRLRGLRGDGRYAGDYSRYTGRRYENTVSEVMTEDVATVREDDPVEYAARMMLDCDCGAIPVVDNAGRLTGMVTDRDITVRLIARGIDARRARVADCMTGETYACREYDSIEECLREMADHQVRRMPVVDDRGRIIGIVSQGDLARHAAEHRGRGERKAVADMLYEVSEPSSSAHN